MNVQRQTIHGLAALSILGMAAMFTPPPAALIIGPTPIETLPFIISSPGAYCLVDNLSGNEGIEITTDDVDIDLGGFTLEGPGLGAVERGIDGAFQDNVRVRNGTLVGWGDWALRTGSNATVEDVCVRASDRGFDLGPDSRVRGCAMDEIADACVALANGSRMQDCQLRTESDTTNCVSVTDYCVVKDVTTRGGKTGFYGGNNVHLERCVALTFLESGIEVQHRGVLIHCQLDPGDGPETPDGIKAETLGRIDGCTVYQVGGVGIQTGFDCSIADCSVTRSGLEGIRAGAGNRIRDCIVQWCGRAGTSEAGGIHAKNGTVIEDTSVSDCGGVGIWTDNACTFRNNILIQNSDGGFRVNAGAVIEGNQIQDCAPVGVRMVGQLNVVKDNTAYWNEVGIRAEDHSNVITGNRATNNNLADFDVTWGNAMGPIRRADANILGSQPHLNYGHD